MDGVLGAVLHRDDLAAEAARRPDCLICHNLVDHEANGVKAAISRYFIGMATGYLVHSRAQAETLAERSIRVNPWRHTPFRPTVTIRSQMARWNLVGGWKLCPVLRLHPSLQGV